VLSGLERFLVEFVRRNEATVGGLTTPQVESLVLMVVGTVWIALVGRREGGLSAQPARA
jgi:phosphatidylglycerol---prolipoprotein diacylglyceryl transferase